MTPREKLKLAELFIKAKINLQVQCHNIVTYVGAREEMILVLVLVL